MCMCAYCPAFVNCGDPSCTNDECPNCREAREWGDRCADDSLSVNERGETIEQMPGERI